MRARFSIGDQFIPRGRNQMVHTIQDVYTTINVASEVVRVRYVATHAFMGQPVVGEFVDATVAMGLVKPD